MERRRLAANVLLVTAQIERRESIPPLAEDVLHKLIEINLRGVRCRRRPGNLYRLAAVLVKAVNEVLHIGFLEVNAHACDGHLELYRVDLRR